MYVCNMDVCVCMSYVCMYVWVFTYVYLCMYVRTSVVSLRMYTTLPYMYVGMRMYLRLCI